MNTTKSMILRCGLLTFLLASMACAKDPLLVNKITPSDSGRLYAVELLHPGSATVGTTTFVAIYRDTPPQIGTEVPQDDLCFVWIGYRIGPKALNWQSENRLLAVVKGSKSAYENTIQLNSCDGVGLEWRFERP